MKPLNLRRLLMLSFMCMGGEGGWPIGCSCDCGLQMMLGWPLGLDLGATMWPLVCARLGGKASGIAGGAQGCHASYAVAWLLREGLRTVDCV